jgi:putative membrane protein
MKHLLLRWLASALALMVIVNFVPGIHVIGENKIVTLLITAAVLGLVNSFIRPIIMFFVWPLNCLTFGLMGFVVNVLMFQLTDYLVDDFKIDSLLWAVIGALAMGLLSGLFNFMLGEKREGK